MKFLLTLLLLVASAVAQTVPAKEIRFKPGTTGAIAGAYRLVLDPTTFRLRCIGPGSADCMPEQTGGGGGAGVYTINGISDAVQTFAITNDTNVNLAINSAGTVHTWVVTWAGTLAKSRQHAQTAYYDAATNTFTNGITAPTFTGGLVGNAATATALNADPGDCASNNFATAINTLGTLSCTQVGYGQLTGVPTTFAPTAHVLNSATHTVSGLTTGHFLRALSATSFGFSALIAADVPTLNQNTTGTAAALAANGTNCGAGNYPLGVDAAGNAENCTSASGGGTVTNFSAGDLSPLFTTSEATTTSTPALTFTMTNAAQNAVLAGPTSGTGAYSFRALVPADIPTLNQNTTGSAGSLSAVLGCAQHPALTGGVTSSAGSCATTLASSVVQNNIANTYTSAGSLDLSAAVSLVIPKSGGAAPTADGQLAFDTTKDAWAFGGSVGASGTNTTGYMPRFFSFQGPSSTLDAGTITTTETAYSISYTLPANFFAVGKTLIVVASIQDVAPATVAGRVLKMRLQKTGPVNVNLTTTASASMTVSSTRSVPMLIMVRCVTTGATGTVDVIPIGFLNSASSVVPQTVVQPVTIDTTVAQTLQFTITFAAGTAGNTTQLRALMVGELN